MAADLNEIASGTGETTPRRASRVGAAIGAVTGWCSRFGLLVESVSVVALSTVFFVIGFGPIGRLRFPLAGGDLIPAYVVGRMWADGSPFGDATVGFPFGMDLRYFPTADLTQNILVGLFGAATKDAFLATNLLFAASFPLTALAMLWVVRLSGLRGPVAVLAAVGLTLVPYHWLRIGHIYLGTMYSAVLAVALALLVGTGELRRRLHSRRRVWHALALLAAAFVVGASGVYYACFGILLIAVAAVYDAVRSGRLRSLLVGLAPAALVVASLGFALFPAWWFVRQHPALAGVAERFPFESVSYSGALAFVILPAPLSQVPGMGAVNEFVQSAYVQAGTTTQSGVIWYADAGSLFTVAAILVALGGALFALRRRAAGVASLDDAREVVAEPVDPNGRGAVPVTLGLVGTLLAVVVLFFVPWGLNFLFAMIVSPQLRAWDRLVPVIYTLAVAAAAVAWRRWRISRGRVAPWVVLVVGLAVLLMDSVLPYRSQFFAWTDAGAGALATGRAYTDQLESAVPGQCAVLQLPYVAYPEAAPVENLSAYEHLWLPLADPSKDWSFGAMKGTVDSAWLEELGSDIDGRAVDELSAGGFCAIHVDRRGYTQEQYTTLMTRLRDQLGAPVATGHDGDWSAFRLPSHGSTTEDVAADLDELPDDTQLFWAPPRIRPTGVPTALPEGDAFSTWWTLPGVASFDITSIDPTADFSGVSMQVEASTCSARTVTVTLDDGTSQASTTVRLDAGQSAPVALDLPSPTTRATMQVDFDGQACIPTGGSVASSVTVRDPLATW